nr:unnamed protein product [Spirometra erinaceieuropaei]
MPEAHAGRCDLCSRPGNSQWCPPRDSCAEGIIDGPDGPSMSDLRSPEEIVKQALRVADVGSGKGYLGTYLSLAHGIRVLEIDSREVNTRSSKQRRVNVQKFWNLQSHKQTAASPREKRQQQEVEVFQSDCASLTCSVTSASQLDSLLAQAARRPAPRCMLTGLHSCGGLSVTLLRTFVESSRVEALVNAPCCYHLLQEAGGSSGDFVERLVPSNVDAPQDGAFDFPMSHWLRSEYPWLRLGRNARTVASQPLERLASLSNLLRAGKDPASISDLQSALNECFPRTTYYRVILQQLLLDHLPPEQHRPTEWIVGRRNHQRRKLVSVPPVVGSGDGGGGSDPPSSSAALLVNVGRDPQTGAHVDELRGSGESFVSYTRWCLQRLGLEELSDSLTDDFIAAYPSRFPGLESKVHCHYMMRCCFGPVVEACVLLDRVLFLLEAGREHSLPVTARLVRVFDPLISPRCHAIVATR